VEQFERIATDFADVVDTIHMYISEAHASDGWHFSNNVCYRTPHTIEDRLAIARDFSSDLHIKFPVLVDDMTDECDAKFRAWPERLFVIENGVVVYRGGIGPFGYHPSEVAAFLGERFGRPPTAVTCP